MIATTLYANNEADINIEEHDDRFCLNLTQLFHYDLSIVGQREVFEKIYEVLEQNLYDELTYKELEEEIAVKELLLEQAESQIQTLEDKIEFLQR